MDIGGIVWGMLFGMFIDCLILVLCNVVVFCWV